MHIAIWRNQVICKVFMLSHGISAIFGCTRSILKFNGKFNLLKGMPMMFLIWNMALCSNLEIPGKNTHSMPIQLPASTEPIGHVYASMENPPQSRPDGLCSICNAHSNLIMKANTLREIIQSFSLNLLGNSDERLKAYWDGLSQSLIPITNIAEISDKLLNIKNFLNMSFKDKCLKTIEKFKISFINSYLNSLQNPNDSCMNDIFEAFIGLHTDLMIELIKIIRQFETGIHLKISIVLSRLSCPHFSTVFRELNTKFCNDIIHSFGILGHELVQEIGKVYWNLENFLVEHRDELLCSHSYIHTLY